MTCRPNSKKHCHIETTTYFRTYHTLLCRAHGMHTAEVCLLLTGAFSLIFSHTSMISQQQGQSHFWGGVQDPVTDNNSFFGDDNMAGLDLRTRHAARDRQGTAKEGSHFEMKIQHLGQSRILLAEMGDNDGGHDDDTSEHKREREHASEFGLGTFIKTTELEAPLIATFEAPPPLSTIRAGARRATEMLYGNKPVVLGLDQCAAFQASVRNEDAIVAPAGSFNTGTNLMWHLLRKNCVVNGQKGKGIAEQVPWGKHNPASWRRNYRAKYQRNIAQETVLPVVVIKDPFTWMTSMCRHPYATRWPREKERCPNLARRRNGAFLPENSTAEEIAEVGGVAVTVTFGKANQVEYASLAHFWNTWYGEWKTAIFPRLMVRFEDLLLRPETTIRQVCECAGGSMNEPFIDLAESAKGVNGAHKGASDRESALAMYGNLTRRHASFLAADLKFAKSALDTALMAAFRYI